MLFFAQTVGGTDLGLASIITTLGLSGVFLWQWQDERKERRAAQTRESQTLHEMQVFTERMLPILIQATAALERLHLGMALQVEKAERSAPTPQEMAFTIRRLEDVADDLGRRLRRDRGD